MVFLDFYDDQMDADSVISNGFLGIHALICHLIECGNRHIGFVGTLQATDSIMDRYLGYTMALIEHGLPQRPDWIIKDRYLETGNTVPVMQLPEKIPTAFICNCDIMAVALMGRLKQQGLSVPDDISVVGFDDYQHNKVSDVGLTTFAVDIPEMTKCAVKMRHKRLNGDQSTEGVRIVSRKVIRRDSAKNFQ